MVDAAAPSESIDRAKSGIKKTHVDALFFSLATAKILDLEKVDGVISWNLCYHRDVANPLNDKRKYNIDDSWKGVNVFDINRPRRRVPTVPTDKNKSK